VTRRRPRDHGATRMPPGQPLGVNARWRARSLGSHEFDKRATVATNSAASTGWQGAPNSPRAVRACDLRLAQTLSAQWRASASIGAVLLRHLVRELVPVHFGQAHVADQEVHGGGIRVERTQSGHGEQRPMVWRCRSSPSSCAFSITAAFDAISWSAGAQVAGNLRDDQRNVVEQRRRRKDRAESTGSNCA
jgi:hypothetical protein